MTPYARIELWRFKSKAVGNSAKVFYGALRAGFCWSSDTFQATTAEMVETSGMDPRQVLRNIRELDAADWASFEKKGHTWTVVMDAPPGQRRAKPVEKTESDMTSDGPQVRKNGPEVRKTGHDVRSHHTRSKTRDKNECSAQIAEQLSRVRSVDVENLARSKRYASEVLPSFERRLARGRPLTVDQLDRLDEFDAEIEANAPKTFQPRSYFDSPEHLENVRLRQQVERERLEDAQAAGSCVDQLRVHVGGAA